MDFPFERPICSLADALAASQAAHVWHAHTLQEADELADRLIEIVAFRATNLWQDYFGANTRPGMFLAPPQFATQPHATALLVPVLGYPNFAPDCTLGPSSPVNRPDFFEDATCDNLLGSMLLGELFRRLMFSRFGPPIGTSALNHTSSSWPEPPLWQGIDAVLTALMTSGHRSRREARLLDVATAAVTTGPWQRRL